MLGSFKARGTPSPNTKFSLSPSPSSSTNSTLLSASKVSTPIDPTNNQVQIATKPILADKASDPKPYTSISSYMNLHNSFANYYLIVQDGSYQCVNYKLLEPEIEDSSRLLKSHYRFFYGFVLYISIL